MYQVQSHIYTCTKIKEEKFLKDGATVNRHKKQIDLTIRLVEQDRNMGQARWLTPVIPAF